MAKKMPQKQRNPKWVSSTLKLLNKYCPVDLPVVVTFVPKLSWWADTVKNKDHYLIRISKKIDISAGYELLAHEYAHCRAWDKSKIDHGAAWGEEYARAYRVIIDDWRPKTGI